MKAQWPRIRAAILTTLVLFNVLAAIPSPGYMTKEKMKRPIVRAELKRWVEFFGTIGIDTDEESLGDWYVGFSQTYERSRATIIWPYRWFMDLTRTYQGWRLFGTPDERPYSLQVEVEDAKGRRTIVYESRSRSEHRWQSGMLEFRRVRGCYNPGFSGPPNTYRKLAERISERAFEDFPDARAVRVSTPRHHTTLPHEPDDAQVELRHVIRFPRRSP